MTGKERVLNALEHKEGDRVPTHKHAMASSVASEILGREVFVGSTSLFYEEAKAWLKGEKAHKEFEEKVWDDLIAITKYFEFDTISMPWRMMEKPTKQLDEYTFLYGEKNNDKSFNLWMPSWHVERFSPSSRTFGLIDSSDRYLQPEDIPRKVEQMEKDYASSHHPLTEEDFPGIKRLVDSFGDKLAVIGNVGMGMPITAPWLEAMLLRPEAIERYLDIQLARALESLKTQAKMGVKIFWGGADMASKSGPVYSPRLFHKFMLPRLQKVSELCDKLNVYHIFKSDGNLWPVAEDLFVKSSIHGYVEIEGDAGMNLERLKKEYGHLTLWGNLSTHLLRVGTVKEVIRETKNCIDKAAEGGGYVFSVSNAILYGTPPENVIAMYKTAKEYGKY